MKPRRKNQKNETAPLVKNVEVEILRVAFGGEGIGSVEGKTCFVEGALPGETVIAKILQDKKNFIKARAIKIVSPSPARVAPPCAYVDQCGGCQYQHVSYAQELLMKEMQVREALQRGLGLPGDVVKSIRRGDKEYGYRNSVTLHRTSKDELRPQRLGFVGRDNKSHVVVSNCLLVDPRLSAVFQASLRLRKGADKLTFRLSEKSEIATDQDETFTRIRIGQETLLASSRGFFQNNLSVTALLADQIREWVDETRPDAFYDVYAGVGTFSFLSAKNVSAVYCIEESSESLQALRMNRAEKGRTSLEIFEGRAEKAFPVVFTKAKSANAMLCLDPPRGGLEKELAEFIGKKTDCRAVVYVSCDLATLTRDLRILTESGRYRVREAVPFDMFPRTKHIEVAVILSPLFQIT